MFLDISRLPGQIDWIVESDAGWYLNIEEKQPGKENNFTEGEINWLGSMGFIVVTQPDMVKYAILENVGQNVV